jgi:hypothetical protein
MPDIRKTMCVASASELIQQSDLYMTVKMIMFTTPTPNLNGVACTERFIDEIIANQDAYVGLPLNADIRSLESGQYDKLGHMFDQTTGTFATAIIGSFYKFEKAALPNGDVALIGYARIMKRNKAVCSAIGELFASGNLKFSFEISCGEYSELEDGTMVIDASEENLLEGMCIVWSPACPEAVAEELVAELTNDRKEAEEMVDESAQITAEVVEQTAEEVTKEVAEETTEEVAEKAATEETVAEETAQKAEEEAEEVDATCKKDSDDKEEDAEKKRKCAEDSAEPEEEGEKAEEEIAEAKSGEEIKNTEVAAEDNELKNLIAELVKSVNEMREEISELRAEKTVIASIAQDTNGFMDTISVSKSKYSLLEREPGSAHYSLLDVE